MHLNDRWSSCGGVVLLTSLCAAAGLVVNGAAAEQIVASARAKSAIGLNAMAPVRMMVDRFATAAERDALVAAVKKGGTQAAYDLLIARPDAGTLQLGGRATPIKYAYERASAAGRLITAVTVPAIAYLGARVPGVPTKPRHQLGVVMLEVVTSGSGKGELVRSAAIRVSEEDTIITEDYDVAEVVQLSDVRGVR